QSVQFTSSPTSKHYLTLRFNGATKRVTDDAVTIYIDGKRVTGNFSKYKDAFSLTGGFSIQIPIRFPEIKISIYLSNALHGSQYKVPVNMPCDYLMLLKYDEATGTFSEVYELKEV
ncbi:MAG: hypothetical protein LBL81_04000, partial [Tannerella sp.]|nr:hypothetical protein [Tannerella sp.]